MSEPRTKAEILRAAELFKRALQAPAALRDHSAIPRRTAAETNYQILRWASGEDNSVVELLAAMEWVEIRRKAAPHD